MSPRKKLKHVKCIEEENKSTAKCKADCMDAQRQVTGERVTDSGSYENEKCYLPDLPNEVLLSIYSFLSPVDLEAISELGDERLTDLTFCIKEANFYTCRKVSPERISAFFTIRRVLYIKELNFNYTFYVKPEILCQLICRCKDITILSVVECGIKYRHLLQIFINCPQLEELSWNVEEIVPLTTSNAKNMKTVYLFCNSKEVSLRSIFFIIQKFPYVKNIWINFSSDAISELPFIGLWLKATSVFNSTLNKRVTLLTNSFQCISDASDLHVLQEMIDHYVEISPLYSSPPCNIVYQDLVNGHVTIPQYFAVLENNEQHEARPKELASRSQTFMCLPFVQLFSAKKDVAELLSQPSNAFTSVSLILTPEILDLREDLVKSMNQASGIKLKHLCMICEGVTSPGSNQYPVPLTHEESLAVCDILEKLFSTSQYVTVLSLVTVHFTSGSPFGAISKLKYLRTLNIPSCAFYKGRKKALMGHVEFENYEFKAVVSNCALVEDFSLVCCADDDVSLTDCDLSPIKQWEELKELTLYCVVIHSFNFLRKVADSCKKLRSFSLVTAACNCEYLYINDVIYLLKNARNLSFIRINEEYFDPMYQGFWEAIGEAVNLEGICIITQSKVAIENQVIVKAIEKLKYLHLFHFFAIRAADHLYLQIKKAIEDNGIVNYRMEKLCNINSFSSAASKRYYHQQPHFCCQHIHFRKFSSKVL